MIWLQHIRALSKKSMSDKIILVAGPCVIETSENAHIIAKTIKETADEFNLDYYFKASFDKANRTSIQSFRGPGLDKGLEILKKIKDELGVKIATDIHEPAQALPVAEVADMIQIPAFLCRQTDLLLAAGRTQKIINVKKGQFIAPQDVINIIEKIKTSGNNKIMICERGTSFGYNRLVVDMTGIAEMKKFGYPIVIDATHSVQLPGANGMTTGGNREHIETIAKAAVAAGATALFFEVHPNVEQALSDGSNMLPLDDFQETIKRVLKVYHAVND